MFQLIFDLIQKNFIEGYDLLRTFLSETKSRFASDSIEDICYWCGYED